MNHTDLSAIEQRREQLEHYVKADQTDPIAYDLAEFAVPALCSALRTAWERIGRLEAKVEAMEQLG